MKFQRFNYLFFSLAFLFSSFYSHTQTVEWLRQCGGKSFDEGKSICSDRNGSIYVTGFFNEKMSMPLGNDSITAISAGESDVFIVKLNQSGELIWFKTFGGTSYDGVFAITTDEDGNVLLTGNFWGTTDFNPSTEIENHSSNGDGDIYIEKLDTDGNFLWVRTFGGTEFDNSLGICSDHQNNVYTTGHFKGRFQVNDTDSTKNWTSIGQNDAFIQKMDADGKVLWTKFVSGYDRQQGYSIQVDSKDNVIATGTFSGESNVSTLEKQVHFNTHGLIDIYILKLDANANLLWYKTIGGNSYDIDAKVKIDDKDQIYIVGNFYESVDFNPDTNQGIQTSRGEFDVFVEKLDDAGNFLWVRTFGGPELDFVTDVGMDESGQIYLTGYFEKTCNFSPGEPSMNYPSNGSFDSYLLKLNPIGDFLWVKTFGGKKDDHGNSICLDRKKAIYLTGRFYDKMNEEEVEVNNNTSSKGASDTFILKLKNK